MNCLFYPLFHPSCITVVLPPRPAYPPWWPCRCGRPPVWGSWHCCAYIRCRMSNSSGWAAPFLRRLLSPPVRGSCSDFSAAPTAAPCQQADCLRPPRLLRLAYFSSIDGPCQPRPLALVSSCIYFCERVHHY